MLVAKIVSCSRQEKYGSSSSISARLTTAETTTYALGQPFSCVLARFGCERHSAKQSRGIRPQIVVSFAGDGDDLSINRYTSSANLMFHFFSFDFPFLHCCCHTVIDDAPYWVEHWRKIIFSISVLPPHTKYSMKCSSWISYSLVIWISGCCVFFFFEKFVGIKQRLWLWWVELSEREIRGLCGKWWMDEVLEKIILVFLEEEEGVLFCSFLHQVSCDLKKKKWYLKKLCLIHVGRSHATNLPQPCAKCLLLKGEIWRYFAFFLILKLNDNKN